MVAKMGLASWIDALVVHAVLLSRPPTEADIIPAVLSEREKTRGSRMRPTLLLVMAAMLTGCATAPPPAAHWEKADGSIAPPDNLNSIRPCARAKRKRRMPRGQ